MRIIKGMLLTTILLFSFTLSGCIDKNSENSNYIPIEQRTDEQLLEKLNYAVKKAEESHINPNITAWATKAGVYELELIRRQILREGK